MLKEKTSFETINQTLNKYLIDPISETVNREKEMITGKTKKAADSKDIKFSYPKNGLYGLL